VFSYIATIDERCQPGVAKKKTLVMDRMITPAESVGKLENAGGLSLGSFHILTDQGLSLIHIYPKVITIDSYVEKIVIDKVPLTLRFSVNMKTLRFKRSMERSNGVEVFQLFGTCTDRTIGNQ